MTAVHLNHRVEWLYDGFAADRSLALLVSDYTFAFLRVSSRFYVVADEAREAAIECAALVKLMTAICLNHRVEWFCDGYAADRSLALLVSDYTLVFFRVFM